jgi:hypothetical protein
MVGAEVKSDFSTVRRDAIKRSATNSEVREYMRQIFNNSYEDSMPASLKASVEGRGVPHALPHDGNICGCRGYHAGQCPARSYHGAALDSSRHDQVIGRAIRICSHAKLPMAERTVKISFYLSVFTEAQSQVHRGRDQRRADSSVGHGTEAV